MDRRQIICALEPLSQIRDIDGIDIREYAALARSCQQNGTDIAVWSDAVDQALVEHGHVYLPDAQEPYYIDRPIILDSGQRLCAGQAARICTVSGMTTCMVRNRNITVYPYDTGKQYDHDIVVNGGVWSNERSLIQGPPRVKGEAPMAGAHGAFLFSNVHSLALTRLCFKSCAEFAIQIGNALSVFLSDIEFSAGGDGVHLNGPLDTVMVQNLSGCSGDDFLALNAWDWPRSAINYGPIRRMLIRNLRCRGGHRAIRLLAGEKTYEDGVKRQCQIEDIVLSDIHGINEFKLYAQPEAYLDAPGGCVVGDMDNIYFDTVAVDYDAEEFFPHVQGDPRVMRGVFEILANIRNITLRDITVNLPFDGSGPALVDIGPKSAVGRMGDDPLQWPEIYLPNGACTVRQIILSGIKGTDGLCVDKESLIHEIQLQINEDYPNTLPRGGIGWGKVESVRLT